QVVLLMGIFSSTVSVDSRYMYALLPFVSVLVMQICAMLPRRVAVALVFVAFGQWIVVHAAALTQQRPFQVRSEWLKPLQVDRARYEEITAAVRAMSEGPEHNNFVGIEEPWLNANSLAFFSAKERLGSGSRTYFVSPG